MIVLARSKPAEAVLTSCKVSSGGVPDAGTNRSRHHMCARIDCTQLCTTLMNT
jgi:hypothetical protein